ncbi:MAG: hypothetical protein ACLQBB_00425 [Solirubrobacteraceae bacterium]
MLAYVFWHRPAHGVGDEAYERALLRFHRSLARQPPSGFQGSAPLRAVDLPWLEGPSGARGGGYEDWYLLDSWDALGVLEAAAVARGHVTAHDEAARRAGAGAGAVYRLLEGSATPDQARLAAWVSPAGGQADPKLADLLEDGMDPGASSLWRRSLVLGPAPELCLLSASAALEACTGLAATRLPAGWTVQSAAREPVPDE